MTASQPLVSVVMPSYNQVGFIEAAIRSVLEQDYPNIELIVADGGSDDGTVDLLKALQMNDGRLRWFSRRDSGPSQAINAALDKALGTVVGWLNSDDLYTSGAVRRAVDAFQANPMWLMVYGQGQHIDGNDKRLNNYPTLPPSTSVIRFAEGCFICQPTVFFQRALWVLLGNLDENLKTAFDFDYWLRGFLAFPDRIGFVDALQAYSRLHDGCITLRMRRVVILEGMQVLDRHLGSAPKEWLLTYAEELISGRAIVSEDISIRDEVLSAVYEATQWMRGRDKELLLARLTNDKRLDG